MRREYAVYKLCALTTRSKGRWTSPERLVGAFVVEFLAEDVEAPLLGGAITGRWARGLGLEGPVHALVSPILLGFARFDEFGQDPDPKGRQRGETGERGSNVKAYR